MLAASQFAWAAGLDADSAPPEPEEKEREVANELLDSSDVSWTQFEMLSREQQKSDYINGLSYIISGTLAVAGGFVGQGATADPIEKSVYTVFQSIGIASIGYGAYTWKIGGEERLLYNTLSEARISDRGRTSVLRSYLSERKERRNHERVIKAITHGLIAGLNLYTASQQTQSTVKNGLFFIGGVNLLAAISFSFP